MGQGLKTIFELQKVRDQVAKLTEENRALREQLFGMHTIRCRFGRRSIPAAVLLASRKKQPLDLKLLWTAGNGQAVGLETAALGARNVSDRNHRASRLMRSAGSGLPLLTVAPHRSVGLQRGLTSAARPANPGEEEDQISQNRQAVLTGLSSGAQLVSFFVSVQVVLAACSPVARFRGESARRNLPAFRLIARLIHRINRMAARATHYARPWLEWILGA